MRCSGVGVEERKTSNSDTMTYPIYYRSIADLPELYETNSEGS